LRIIPEDVNFQRIRSIKNTK